MPFSSHRSFCAFVALVGLVTSAPFTSAGVLPPSAKPHGFSLDAMTQAIAPFQDTIAAGSPDVTLLPKTPFQILYIDQPGGTTNSFTVKPGTSFYLPIFGLDDSPPILGDFPTNSSDVADYLFGLDEIGATDIQIVIDGKVTNIGEKYASSLIETPLPYGGSHAAQVAAFLTPLPPGTHTIEFHVLLEGQVILDIFGEPLPIDGTYTVTVAR